MLLVKTYKICFSPWLKSTGYHIFNFRILFSFLFSAVMTGCTNITTSQYEATALTSYTWQVKYANNLTTEPSPRLEEFATTSLLNRNGLKPPGAFTGPDDRGLWWAALPPRPTVGNHSWHLLGARLYPPPHTTHNRLCTSKRFAEF